MSSYRQVSPFLRGKIEAALDEAERIGAGRWALVARYRCGPEAEWMRQAVLRIARRRRPTLFSTTKANGSLRVSVFVPEGARG